jgi:hypothetical protein
LLHVPDDPGSEPSAEPEHDAESQPQADNTWWRIRLFR